MRGFATGVCVVTTYTDDGDARRHDAMTANSLLSISLDPALVSLCLHEKSRFLADLLSSRVWGVSILDAEGEHLARHFARGRDDREEHVIAEHGRPGPLTGALLVPAAGHMECAYRTHIALGDHVLVVGDVLGLETADGAEPLIFVHGAYHRLDGDCHPRPVTALAPTPPAWVAECPPSRQSA